MSEDIYLQYASKQNIEPEDILIVNDGTYLMGRTAMVTEADKKIVIQSHIRQIKILKKETLSPYLLIALLGLEIVQKQIESKSFRQGTISTLGNRLSEVQIPIPVDNEIKKDIIINVKKTIADKKQGKLFAQEYKLLDKTENLMGIKNKAKIGNL